MRKITFEPAFLLASLCAFASPASDAAKTFFAKGNADRETVCQIAS